MPDTSRYDVVVVGSGLGGLLTAVFLAKEGLKVCVIEKNKQIGGCLQTFSVQKKVFDSCVHYVGGLGEGHALNRIFSYAGIMDKLALKALDADGYDHIAFGGDDVEYPLACGPENFVTNLLPYFPDEKAALEQYLELVKDVTSRFPAYNLRMGDAGEKMAVVNMELTETLAGLTDNKLLQQVLAGNNLLYAGVAGKTPFYVHALVTESYLHSAHKVLPGSSQISKFLWQELISYGGEVVRNTKVDQLVAKDGRIAFALGSNGVSYFADRFVSAIHPALLEGLLDNSLLRPAFHNRIKQLDQTSSAFCLNIVLQPGTVPYKRHNTYWHAQPDSFIGIEDKANWPSTYALYFSEDPAQPGFAETVAILTYMPFEFMDRWSGTHNHTGVPSDRGEEYAAAKNRYAAQLLARVGTRYPEIAGNIQAQSASTPLTYRDYTGSPEGSLYGILKDVGNATATTIATRTKIPNLFLTGQNVNLHGVLGVSITAVITAAEILGMEYLLNKINEQ